MAVETRFGRLFDLGPDGLGFIADHKDNRIWAFQYPEEGVGLAASVDAFLELEGKQVQFFVEEGRIRSVEVLKTASAGTL